MMHAFAQLGASVSASFRGWAGQLGRGSSQLHSRVNSAAIWRVPNYFWQKAAVQKRKTTRAKKQAGTSQSRKETSGKR
ncbi:hypothetical protein LX36DRAFT_656043 [Colletotrichum falcatum]|nr:hypothetical protein LX36DRAFT_656043 [Colletotrichum falcatum]